MGDRLGATLTACLAGAGRADVPAALHRYEQLRLPRASRVQAMAAANKTQFHLPDGPEQQERDAPRRHHPRPTVNPEGRREKTSSSAKVKPSPRATNTLSPTLGAIRRRLR